LAVLSLASPAAAQPAGNPAALFGVRESVREIDISPDGQRVVYLTPGPGRTTAVVVTELGTDSEPRIVTQSDGNPQRLRSCSFVTNQRLVCEVGGMGTRDGLLVPFSRLISVDIDGRDMKQLGQRESFFDARVRQFDGEIIDWLPGEDGVVLMSRELIPEAGRTGSHIARTANGLAVDRVNVRTLSTDRVEAPNRSAIGYITDGRGNVRVMVMQGARDPSGQLSAEIGYLYRTAGSREWRSLGRSDQMIVLAVDPVLDSAYILRKVDGRYALFRVKLDGSMVAQQVFAHDRVDVSGIVRASHGSRVIGVTYVDDRRHVVYFDEEYAELARSLARSIPNLPLIGFGSASADGNRILVHAGSDADAGRWYVYDRQARSLNEIMLVRPELENVRLATVRSITYPAADGVNIPAYLTLPPGREARGLPAVVLPHGGPTSRDEWGFDWLAQFLAHQGYAVLQPNYRGSAGYGDQWLQQNGFRSWRTSIGDITAGARWLASQGIADSSRLAILGWSYGGYAALQAGVTEPSLFRAIVAIAPVTDLQQAKDDFEDYIDARNNAEFIGSGPHIAEGSPLRHVDAIRAPVLLLHGTRDLNVPVIHSRRMNDALRGAGRSSDLLVFDGLEHDLDDSTARTQMLTRIGAFLSANLAQSDSASR
jgi:dipeptidyl aminopeptidase/acylaminoacyl peptidase